MPGAYAHVSTGRWAAVGQHWGKRTAGKVFAQNGFERLKKTSARSAWGALVAGQPAAAVRRTLRPGRPNQRAGSTPLQCADAFFSNVPNGSYLVTPLFHFFTFPLVHLFTFSVSDASLLIRARDSQVTRGQSRLGSNASKRQRNRAPSQESGRQRHAASARTNKKLYGGGRKKGGVGKEREVWTLYRL